MDREKREAEAKEAALQQKQTEQEEVAANGGLFANVKGGEDILKKLKENKD